MSTIQRMFQAGALQIASLWLAVAAASASAQQPPTRSFTIDTVADLIDDNTADGVCHTSANTCSLRAAIMQANHLAIVGLFVTIHVPTGTYTLTRAPGSPNDEDAGDLNLNTPLAGGQRIALVGAGASNTIIDANHIDRALRIAAGRVVSMSGFTVRNGAPSGIPNFFGGGIANYGNLTLSDCVVEGHATNYGGGVGTSGTLRVLRTTIRANIASQLGGGIDVEGGTATLRDSTVNGNTSGGSGGGITVTQTGAVLHVVNSTISGNVAYTNGGGINNLGTTRLYNATVVGNDADHDQDQNGGIGGGVYNTPGGSFSIVNSLIADNTLGDVPVYNDCGGTLIAFGWNLFYDVSGCSIPNGAAWGFVVPSTIGPLQANGGPTWTHALLAGSRAIDTTDDLGCIDETGAYLVSDQRGGARVTGNRCDVGAFEYGSIADRIFADGFGNVVPIDVPQDPASTTSGPAKKPIPTRSSGDSP